MKQTKGIAYPVQKTTQGFFHASDDVAQIKASMLTILMTRPGERVFEPYFGTPIHKLDINKPLELLEEDCRLMIAQALRHWESRYPVTDVKVSIVGYEINVTITFVNPANLQDEHLLTLQMPLGV